MKTNEFIRRALEYATAIYKLYKKLNLYISQNMQENKEWQKTIEYIYLVEEMEHQLYASILPASLIWIKSAKEKLLEMHSEKNFKNTLNFYIEGENQQEQIIRRVESKLNKIPYDNILFGLEITDPSNYIFNDWLRMYWQRIKKNSKNPTVQAMLFRLAYLDETFESLCIRNGFSAETNYLPILNREQEEKYPEDTGSPCLAKSRSLRSPPGSSSPGNRTQSGSCLLFPRPPRALPCRLRRAQTPARDIGVTFSLTNRRNYFTILLNFRAEFITFLMYN